jgi:hypothetical protein
VTTKRSRKKVKGEQLESMDCFCSKGDDGSPMILCSMCKIWCVHFHFPSPCAILGCWSALIAVATCRYHFTCVDITEPQAEEISESPPIIHCLYVADFSSRCIYLSHMYTNDRTSFCK